MKAAIFSGRFDPPHLGHIESITELGQEFEAVIIPVLDHKGQYYPVQYRAQRLREILSRCKGNYTVVVNKTHFAKIEKENANVYLEKYGKNVVYCSGNMDCLRNMESLGWTVRYIDKSGHEQATDDRRIDMIKKAMK